VSALHSVSGISNVTVTSQFWYTSSLIKRHSDEKIFKTKRLRDSKDELHSKQDIESPSGQTISGRSRVRLSAIIIIIII
jgi:hypothetical protein